MYHNHNPCNFYTTYVFCIFADCNLKFSFSLEAQHHTTMISNWVWKVFTFYVAITQCLSQLKEKASSRSVLDSGILANYICIKTNYVQEDRKTSSFLSFLSNFISSGIFFIFWHKVPTIVILWFLSFLAVERFVKKLSVVTFSPALKQGIVSFITTWLPRPSSSRSAFPV